MIAITGANGLLGNFILKKFLSEHREVIGLKRSTSDLSLINNPSAIKNLYNADVTDFFSLTDALKEVDTVIHSAAVVSFDPRAKAKIFQTNVIGTQNIVNACLALGIPRLLFISSVAALGRSKGVREINESNKWIESNLNSDYAKSKYLAELEVYRGQEEGLSISIVNPSIILAPGDSKKSSAQIFNYIQNERSFYVDGNLNYVDVRDVADLVFKIYETPQPGEKFIASGGSATVKELMSKIAIRLRKKEPSVKINPYLVQAAAWLEEKRCEIMGTEAIISRQSVKMTREKFIYQNQKSVDLLQMTYRSLDETLDWCCDYYRNAFTTNKAK